MKDGQFFSELDCSFSGTMYLDRRRRSLALRRNLRNISVRLTVGASTITLTRRRFFNHLRCLYSRLPFVVSRIQMFQDRKYDFNDIDRVTMFGTSVIIEAKTCEKFIFVANNHFRELRNVLYERGMLNENVMEKVSESSFQSIAMTLRTKKE